MRRKLEYAAAWPFLKIMGVLPRPLARAFAIGIAQLVYLLHFRLRQVGMRNLAMVFPEKSLGERRAHLAWSFHFARTAARRVVSVSPIHFAKCR